MTPPDLTGLAWVSSGGVSSGARGLEDRNWNGGLVYVVSSILTLISLSRRSERARVKRLASTMNSREHDFVSNSDTSKLIVFIFCSTTEVK